MEKFIKCNYCHSDNINKYQLKDEEMDFPYYKCRECGKFFIEEKIDENNKFRKLKL